MTVQRARVVPVVEPPAFVLPRGRVAQLAGDEVRVLGHDLRPQAIVAPGGVRALATLADGSLLVVGRRETCVLAATRDRADAYPKLSIGARQGWAWGAADPRRFFLAEATFLGENELPERPGEEVAPLAELAVPRGALPFFGGRMVELGPAAIVIHGGTETRRLALPGLDLVHLVAVSGDTAWASDGAALLRLDLRGSAVAVAARVESQGTIVSIDADGDHVAALVAEGEAPSWSVRLYDASGREAWRSATPFQPDAADQGSLTVALGRFDPIVAAGDARRLALFARGGGALLATL